MHVSKFRMFLHDMVRKSTHTSTFLNKCKRQVTPKYTIKGSR